MVDAIGFQDRTRIRSLQFDRKECEMRIYQPNQVGWDEDRGNEGFFLIIAELNGNQWEFWERESWEVSYSPIPASLFRIARAEKLIANRTADPAAA
jgi:hypothetical protein